MPIFSSARTTLFAALFAAMPISASALTPEEATDLTDTIVEEVLGYVNSDMTLAEKQAAFRETMDRYADTSAIGRYVLGIEWRNATPAQQEAFADAFREYLSNKYGSQFSGYEGGEISIGNANDLGNRGIVVESTVERPGSSSIVVQWQFSDRSGQPLLIDIVAEGVSLLTTERTAIANMLDRRGGDLDALIADLPTAR
ncbi:phospholipid transport system substrate-binding protein [Monaibacterium marinum]|uniref:Phospholipid transport system substrate-binding protein n=1 Tax=Pontivivens marinum TaxID=1690039 RepID=A0A2C9CNJ9_9RHOB|nr:ABC transporter substrate-binding protein [Monaibacterium marinum]SOH92823.1 phospholipid transport system substrate-binding protein [Monaibacterium marinum]